MSLAGKSGYKETEVGWIPSDWRCEHLGGHISMLTGAPFKSELFSSSEGVPLIRIRDLLRGFSETGYAGEYDERYIVNTGDVLVGMDGEFHVVRWKGSRALLNQRVLKISHRPGISDLGFLFFFVAAAIGKIQDGISATTVKHLSTKDLQNLTAAVPPLPEQQKIAAILTTVDDKLDVIARQIKATQTLKRGLMQTLFSRGVGTQDADGRWVPHTEFKDSELGEIPATWFTTSFGAVCKGALQTGPFGSQLHADEYQDNGVPVLMPKDLVGYRANLASAARISPARAEELSKHKLLVGDLLFSRRGDVARFALIDEESEGALCGTGCLKAHPSTSHNSSFLAQLLQLDVVRAWLEQNAVGQTMPNMNTGILSSLPLVMPIDRREQDEIACILDSVDSKLQVLGTKHSHFARLKRGLIQKLLTGEWRVNVDTNASVS
ncbi:restriction endonuclease subunit S [Zoogloea sp.]|uniref:restriction endonuclease subunit S n=1 Tax=Zoogloea sp. TaxID=49181 RepID=UPI0035AF8786